MSHSSNVRFCERKCVNVHLAIVSAGCTFFIVSNRVAMSYNLTTSYILLSTILTVV